MPTAAARQVLAADRGEQLRGVHVAIGGDLHAVLPAGVGLEVVPGELREELRVERRVRLRVLELDEGLVTRAAGRVEAAVGQLLHTHHLRP